MNIQTLRGIEEVETNDKMVLVLASVHDVAAALNQSKHVQSWRQDAYGQRIPASSYGLIILQFHDHQWTVIHELNNRYYAEYEQDAKFLFDTLNTMSLYYSISDTGGEFTYRFYSSGECVVEEMKSSYDEGGGISFLSTIRPEITASQIRDDIRFANDFFEAQGIYIPAISFRDSQRILDDNTICLEFDGLLFDSVIQVKLKRNYFERVDYLELQPSE